MLFRSLLGNAFNRSQSNAVDVDDGRDPSFDEVVEFDASMDVYDGGPHQLEDTIDTLIAAQTAIPIEQWLGEGPEIDTDTYSIDSDETADLVDFDYAPGTYYEEVDDMLLYSFIYRQRLTPGIANEAASSRRRELKLVSLAQ